MNGYRIFIQRYFWNKSTQHIHEEITNLKTTENYPCRDNLKPDCEKVYPTNVALTWRHERISIKRAVKGWALTAILAWAGYPGWRRVANNRKAKQGKGSFPSLKLTARPWKLVVGRWISFWDGLFSGAMLVSGRTIIQDSLKLWETIQSISTLFEVPMTLHLCGAWVYRVPTVLHQCRRS